MAFEPMEKPKRPGRKPLALMTQEFEDTLVSYLEEGMGFKASCDLAGVSYTSIRRMVKAGLQDVYTEKDTVLGQFAYRVTAALAEAKRTRIKQLNKAAESPMAWAAAAWWLERMYPQEYGKQDRLSLTMTQGQDLSERLKGIELTDEEEEVIGSILGKLGRTTDSNGDEGTFEFGQGDSSE